MPRLRASGAKLMLGGVKLVLSLLVALAVLFAPMGMMSTNAAPLHKMTAAPMDHCAGKQQPDKKQPPQNCCVMMCAALVAVPAAIVVPANPPLDHQVIEPVARHGLTAEAATPPPRSS